MKRSFVSLLTIAAISMSLISCNNAKKGERDSRATNGAGSGNRGRGIQKLADR